MVADVRFGKSGLNNVGEGGIEKGTVCGIVCLGKRVVRATDEWESHLCMLSTLFWVMPRGVMHFGLSCGFEVCDGIVRLGGDKLTLTIEARG